MPNVHPILVVPALVGCLSFAGCSAAPEDVAVQSEGVSAKCAPDVPSSVLVVPDGNRLEFSLDAIGVQIYECRASSTGYAWAFVAPEATLYNDGGQIAGTHYAGPTWEANDTTLVVGARLAGFTADPTAIPLLLLKAVSHAGDDGRMTRVTYIQRLDTVGGLAPASGCDAAHVGSTARVDYSATYYFYRESTNDSSLTTCD